MQNPPSTQFGWKDWAPWCGFIGLYVFLDWLSYIDPMYGLNITPWNPDPALGIVVWLRYGRRTAVPWFIALVTSEWLVRGLPAGLPLTLLLSAWMVLGYATVGTLLSRLFIDGAVADTRARLTYWLAVVILGLSVNGLVYIGLLGVNGLVPIGAFGSAALRFIIGDIVGVIISMPLIWMLATREGRSSLAVVLHSWETLAYVALAFVVVWGVFRGVVGDPEFKHFYFLFLPIIWAAARHGLPGTGLIAFVLQFGIIMIVRAGKTDDIPFSELQLLGAAMALVGFFIGVIVDEQRQLAEDLKQSLRLAAAGEMAAALAHELNQPMAALAAYGKACEHLLARGDTGPLLAETIGKMGREAGRASEVVRRLRSFFRGGDMDLQPVAVAELVATVCAQFESQCAANHVVLSVLQHTELTVRVDRLQIELVLRNLIANALDAVIEHPVDQRRISVRVVGLDVDRVQLAVEDSGSGLSSAAAARLFEPFVSGKSSGLGLGLVLSRAIVEAHGGRLWAEVGGGGVFKFILPMAAAGSTRV